MSLTRTRAWVAGTAVVCLLLLVASYLLLIAPKREEATALDEQTASTAQTNAQLQSKLTELQAQFADLPQTQAQLAAIQQAIPQDAALPTLVRDLDSTATASGVTLMSLTPGSGVLVPTATAVVEPVATDPAADPAAADTTTTTAAAPPASSDVLVAVPVSLDIVGDFFATELFLKNVQTELSRAFLVTDLTLTAETTAGEAGGGRPATKPGDVSVTITGSVFVLRSAATVASSVTAAGTTVAPTATIVTP